MSDNRNTVLEYLRGIAMLGVVGIHTGAYSLANPEVNEHLFALLEIVTRFSIPVFFYISAFGLFYQQDLSSPFDYKRFLLRRCRSVLLPYLLWSALYMLHYTWTSGDTQIWDTPTVYEYFLFGFGSYQLYFLVILMWFYLFMPLWRFAVRHISQHPLRYLSLLLVFQIIFNYYSSYVLIDGSDNYYLNLALQHRLSYLVLHYVFIFLLGGVCAVNSEKFLHFIFKKRVLISYVFFAALISILSHYYLLVFFAGYSLEAAVNTVHQLSPTGVIYTLASALFWYMAFTFSTNQTVNTVLGFLGKYSYPVYLVHPFFMYYLSDYLTTNAMVMTIPVTLLFFVLTVCLSLAFGAGITKVSAFFPLVGEILTGAKPTKTKIMGAQ